MADRLARTLATTFRQALDLPDDDAVLACPLCYDARDVRGDGRLAVSGLRRFRCRVCKYDFAETHGTPFAGKALPLPRMAYAALGGPLPVGGWPQSWRTTHSALAATLADSAFAARWRALLEEAGVTPARVLQTIDAGLRVPHSTTPTSRVPRALNKGARR